MSLFFIKVQLVNFDAASAASKDLSLETKHTLVPPGLRNGNANPENPALVHKMFGFNFTVK